MSNSTIAQGSNRSREQRFVEYIFDRCNKNKGFAARMRRAANPATEYQSWETLSNWIELDNPWQRVPYATVAAAIASSRSEHNGSLSLGRALAGAYPDTPAQLEANQSSPANARLRRLLACEDSLEACRVIRPILSLINSRLSRPLDYAVLLSQLYYFGERTKVRWAQDFYRGEPAQGGQEGAA